MANNYTDLKNNYMYGRKNRLNNFYQNYKNFENDLEDPIFTGFTFYINMTQSPLFNGGADYAGTSGGSGLSSQIQSSLKSKHDGMGNDYDVTTTKIEENNSNKIGYGNQQSVFSEGVDYNAIEYIYMVDKILGIDGFSKSKTKSSSSGTSISKTESQDISTVEAASKSAVPTTKDEIKAYNQAAKLAAKLAEADDGDSDTVSKKEQKIQEKIDKFNEANQNYLTNIKDNFEEKNKDYTDAKNEYEKVLKEYEELLKTKSATSNRVSKKTSIISFLSSLMTAASSALKIYVSAKISLATAEKTIESNKKNGTDTSKAAADTSTTTSAEASKKAAEEEVTSATSQIADVITKFKSFKSSYSDEFEKLTSSISGIDVKNNTVSSTALTSIKTELLKDKNLQGKDIQDDWLKASSPDMTSLEVIAYLNSDGVSDLYSELESQLEEYNKESQKLQYQLYGADDTHSDVYMSNGKLTSSQTFENLHSESNASDDSLYGKAKIARESLAALKNSEEMQTLAQASEEIGKAMDNFDEDTDVLSSLQNDVPESEDEYENATETVVYDSPLDSKYTITMPTDDEISELMSQSSSTTVSAPQTVVDLIGFINGMSKLINSYPYIFQSVTGLDEAYKNYFKMSEPYQGSGDNKITINCYESIDMRVSSMFNKYFNAAYDREYKRERLPMNLRRFNCSIFVHDIRNFRHALNKLFSKSSTFGEDADDVSNIGMIAEIALNHLSAIEFKFFDCEISQEETGGIFETINNADLGEQRMTKFVFTYGNCYINFLPFNDLANNFSTSGSSNEIGNESTIVNATRKIDSTTSTGITINQQTPVDTDFTAYEKMIPYVSNPMNIIQTEEGANSKSSEETPKFLDKTTMETDNVDYNPNSTGIHNNIDVTPKTGYEYLTDFGDEYINGDNVQSYIGNVEFNDYNEYLNQKNYLNTRDLYTGTEEIYNGNLTYAGNVEIDDIDEIINVENNRNPYLAARDAEMKSRAEHKASNGPEIISPNGTIISEGKVSEEILNFTMRGLSASSGYPVDDLYGKLGLGNVYNEIKSKESPSSNKLSSDYGYKNNYTNISMMDDKHENYKEGKNVYDEYKKYDDYKYGKDINNTNIELKSSSVSSIDDNVFGNDTNQYLTYEAESIATKVTSINSELKETINNNSNTDYNSTFSDIDKKVFTENDLQRGTSTTDYVLSEKTKSSVLTNIGLVEENVNMGDDNLSNEELNNIDKDNEITPQTTESIGTVINNTSENKGNIDYIGQEKMSTKASDKTKEIGSAYKESIENVKPYSKTENVYNLKDKDLDETKDIGLVNQYKDSNEILNNIGKLSNKVEVSEDVKSILIEDEKVENDKSIIKTSKIEDTSTTIDSNNVVYGLGKVLNNEVNEKELKPLGKIGDKSTEGKTYESEKINTPSEESLEYIKKLGKIVTGNTESKVKDEDLNDLKDFTI